MRPRYGRPLRKRMPSPGPATTWVEPGRSSCRPSARWLRRPLDDQSSREQAPPRRGWLTPIRVMPGKPPRSVLRAACLRQAHGRQGEAGHDRASTARALATVQHGTDARHGPALLVEQASEAATGDVRAHLSWGPKEKNPARRGWGVVWSCGSAWGAPKFNRRGAGRALAAKESPRWPRMNVAARRSLVGRPVLTPRCATNTME